jgi:hypothetical protein
VGQLVLIKTSLSRTYDKGHYHAWKEVRLKGVMSGSFFLKVALPPENVLLSELLYLH